MKIEFDPKKDASNLVSTGSGWRALLSPNPRRSLEDTRNEYGEDTLPCFGHIGAKAYVLAFTARESSQANRVRAISLRPATQMEIKQYASRKNSPTIDPDNPEWTADDFARAKKPEEILHSRRACAVGKRRVRRSRQPRSQYRSG